MVEIHYYDPYQYTLMTEDQTWGDMFYFWGIGYHHPTMLDRNATWGEEDWLTTQFQKMSIKFVSQGIPVILGEFHATKRSLTGWDYDLHHASRTYYHKTVQNAANTNGMKSFYWDTPGGFFDWTTGAELDPDNINALTGGAALPPPVSAPAAPSNLTATAVSTSQINLAWSDNSSDESGFRVDRALNSTFTSSLVTTAVGANVTSFQATGLAKNTRYYFRVRAYNANGESANSNTVNARTKSR
jgi:hypothetical protein